MKPALSSSLVAALRIALACICGLGIWLSFKLARADYLAHQDTAASLRAALRLVPDSAPYYMRLSQLDPEHAKELLEAALRADRYNAVADIELGLRDESDGDFAQAEQLLLAAFSIDRTYLTRWTLTNFYFRRDNTAMFWQWARKAAEMPSGNVVPLFALCWHESPDPDTIARNLFTGNPLLVRQFIEFLMARGELEAASRMAPRLVAAGSPDQDRPQLLFLVDQLVDAKNVRPALSVWNSMAQGHWIHADSTVPNNSYFTRDPVNSRFDWTLPTTAGVRSVTGPEGLRVEFSGSEPEVWVAAYQAVVLKPGSYVLKCSSQSNGISPGSGLWWEVVLPKSGVAVAVGNDLASDGPQTTETEFSVAPDQPVLYLQLVYRRAMGTTRVTGTLVVPSVLISPKP